MIFRLEPVVGSRKDMIAHSSAHLSQIYLSQVCEIITELNNSSDGVLGLLYCTELLKVFTHLPQFWNCR